MYTKPWIKGSSPGCLCRRREEKTQQEGVSSLTPRALLSSCEPEGGREMGMKMLLETKGEQAFPLGPRPKC